LRDAALGLGIVAEKAQSNFVAAVTGTVPRAPDCVGGGLGEPSPAPHPSTWPRLSVGRGLLFAPRAGTRSHRAKRWRPWSITADPRRGACPTRLAIRSQVCAMASRSARPFSAETVRALSRHLAASRRYSSGLFLVMGSCRRAGPYNTCLASPRRADSAGSKLM
jgi:hypothetical protein